MCSCKEETNTLPSLVFFEYTKSKFVYFDCDVGKLFRGFGATYLENTSQDYSVKSFDLDTLKQELYWIDGTNNELYKYVMQKDSVLRHFPLPNEAWDHCVCLSNDKILLTIRNYPNNIYYIFDSTNGATQKFQ